MTKGQRCIIDTRPNAISMVAWCDFVNKTRKLVGRTVKFDSEIRKLALRLQFYNPKAYDYVRREWEGLLSHPGTLRQWY